MNELNQEILNACFTSTNSNDVYRSLSLQAKVLAAKHGYTSRIQSTEYDRVSNRDNSPRHVKIIDNDGQVVRRYAMFISKSVDEDEDAIYRGCFRIIAH